ncbi:MAG: aminopeptidase, partial [Butyrivibrio hungatei]|nr:aminopeptidase [Butyrivibrio hungatei]
MPKKKETKKIKTSELFAEFPNLYEVASEDDMTATFNFAEEYKAFLDNSKTEREFAANAIAAAEDLGYVDIATKDTLKPGDKVYQSIKGKGFAAAVIGKKSPAEGFNILGAHIDSPRLDLKPNPIYEDNDTVYFNTHYYGGKNKYQWTTIPLAV